MTEKNQVFSVTVENGVIKRIDDTTFADKERHNAIATNTYAINITGEHKNNYLEVLKVPSVPGSDMITNNLQHGQLSEEITKRILGTKNKIPSTIIVNGKEVSYESFCKTLAASEANLLLADMKKDHGVSDTTGTKVNKTHMAKQKNDDIEIRH